ncbi:MAG: hypothetical protein AABZ47_08835 [Planctomycetota bacterium]
MKQLLLFHQAGLTARVAALLGGVCFFLLNSTCIHRDCFPYLNLRGQVLDAETQNPLSEVTIRGRSLNDGQLPLGFYTEDMQTVVNGTFLVSFDDERGICEPFPIPDQVEITVVLSTCDRVFLIEVNADTFVDPTFPMMEGELRESILVPPCP